MNFRPLPLVWLLAGLAGFELPAAAANYYVSPRGDSNGRGTPQAPYRLSEALSGQVGRPGDTFWLRGGDYPLGHLSTEVHGEPGKLITFRQFPGERAHILGSLSFWGAARYLVLRDFELSSGVSNRVSRQVGVGFNPTDLLDFCEGIQVYASDCNFINLVVHDTVRSGFWTSSAAINTLIYGCLVYNVGWSSPDNAEGHSYYLQAPGEVSDCLALNSAGAGFHVYSDSPGERIGNLEMEGDLACGAGALQSVRPYRDWIIGVDRPAMMADNIRLRRNLGYVIPGARTLGPVQLGRQQLNGRLVLESNYWPQGVSMGQWQNCTGAEMLETAPGQNFTGTKIFIRTNRYEPGRAHLMIYNWDRHAKVAVNICSILPPGTCYEVRNAGDFFGAPVLSGIFDGEPIELSMTGLSVARPSGGLATPPPTGPVFNVFILLPVRTISKPTPPTG